ncbi:hypothetical protein, unlikely [Trypanosoma brucei gambiense DAL972]|uniref:Uncharacterized protein n=1 Tax=Trypanosoma brucei gambiense (strain MHOM/CI/86/DAL972) TaxID=679716 RepID=D0A6V2_TRYB9|nr:hypothetical protein, unlikely [Trypanosoma brucei gambiense DAL972]CBH17403.1 hypothetical protein, unlikely [Trypanosoma brucei gambiense DAL972]|eukprot:XP_011779667.1 hypothetical protein, unlikely [Trypanosoma brucei gambiense DAL972]
MPGEEGRRKRKDRHWWACIYIFIYLVVAAAFVTARGDVWMNTVFGNDTYTELCINTGESFIFLRLWSLVGLCVWGLSTLFVDVFSLSIPCSFRLLSSEMAYSLRKRKVWGKEVKQSEKRKGSAPNPNRSGAVADVRFAVSPLLPPQEHWQLNKRSNS